MAWFFITTLPHVHWFGRIWLTAFFSTLNCKGKEILCVSLNKISCPLHPLKSFFSTYANIFWTYILYSFMEIKLTSESLITLFPNFAQQGQQWKFTCVQCMFNENGHYEIRMLPFSKIILMIENEVSSISFWVWPQHVVSILFRWSKSPLKRKTWPDR